MPQAQLLQAQPNISNKNSQIEIYTMIQLEIHYATQMVTIHIYEEISTIMNNVENIIQSNKSM